MSLDAVETALLECVRERAKEPEAINADTLLVKGVLDSLGIINLMTLTEILLGREMADDEFELRRFRSVRTILDEYFSPAPADS
jgi:acyl carrier protein